MADQAALTDAIQELIQGAASTALSPFCDPSDDDWRDAAADQVRDAVLTALSDEGLVIVLVDDVHRVHITGRCESCNGFHSDCGGA